MPLRFLIKKATLNRITPWKIIRRIKVDKKKRAQVQTNVGRIQQQRQQSAQAAMMEKTMGRTTLVEEDVEEDGESFVAQDIRSVDTVPEQNKH